MSAPVIWIIFPIIASIFLLITRRRKTLSLLLQIGLSFILVLLAAVSRFEQIPGRQLFSIFISPEFSFLGRSFIMNETYRYIIMLVYGFLGIWTVCMFMLEQESFLVPLGLALNGLMLAALTVEPFLYSALIIEMSVIICLPILSKPDFSENKGASRFLVYMTLGMPLILLAGWYLAGGEISPINAEQLIQSTLLLGLGFFFWLSVFPFHSWVPIMSDEMESLDGIYILILLPVVIFLLLLKYLNGFSWLREFQLIFDSIRLLGLIMVFSSSVWAVFQTRLRKMMGYLLICSMGMMLLSISLDMDEGFLLSAYFILPRLLTFLLLANALVILEKNGAVRQITDLKSSFFSFPFSSSAMLVALFSISGMPLTLGFTPVQSLYSLMDRQNSLISNLLIGSMAVLTILFFRITYLIFMREDRDLIVLESNSEKYLVLAIIIIMTLIGFFPALVFPYLSNLVTGFEFLVK